MTAEQILNLIKKHNDTCTFFNTLPKDFRVPVEVIMKLMPLSSKHASLGLEITRIAREHGIDAKCCMQSGEITIQ